MGGHLDVNGWAFTAQMGGAIMAKWVNVFWEVCSKKKHWSSGEYPFWSSYDHGFRSLWTPNPWPTTESVGPLPTKILLCEEPSFLVGTAIASNLNIHSAVNTVLWIFELLSKLGVGPLVGVIIVLTRGRDESLMLFFLPIMLLTL